MPPRRLLAHLDALGVVPVTWWTALILLSGLVVTAPVVLRPFAAATAWRPAPTAAAGLWLTVIAALTLGPGGGSAAERVGCPLPDESFADVPVEVGHDLESALNAVLLGPVGVALVLASRRVLVPVLLVVVLPGLIEVAQLFVPGRFCSPADYILNVAGASPESGDRHRSCRARSLRTPAGVEVAAAVRAGGRRTGGDRACSGPVRCGPASRRTGPPPCARRRCRARCGRSGRPSGRR